MSRRSAREAGFTLVEVLMALLIVATSIAGLMLASTRSLNRAGDTNFLRVAKMLLQAKMGEVIAGTETGSGGSFEEQGFTGYAWDMMIQQVQAGTTESVMQVTVTVHYPTMGTDEDMQGDMVTDPMSDGPGLVRATSFIDPPDAQLVPPGQGGAPAQGQAQVPIGGH